MAAYWAQQRQLKLQDHAGLHQGLRISQGFELRPRHTSAAVNMPSTSSDCPLSGQELSSRGTRHVAGRPSCSDGTSQSEGLGWNATHPPVRDSPPAFTYALRRGLPRNNRGQSTEERLSLKRKSPDGEVRERPNRTHC